jgi:hypothetical protein
MKKFIVMALIITVYFSTLEAEDKEVLVLGHTMYQKQKIGYKTVVTFAADKEGKRVWNWDHAQRYCKNLKLNNYSDWQVASREELLKIMTKDQKKSILYKNRQILKLSNIKDLQVHDAELVFNGKKYAVLASANHLWGVTSRGKMEKLR